MKFSAASLPIACVSAATVCVANTPATPVERATFQNVASLKPDAGSTVASSCTSSIITTQGLDCGLPPCFFSAASRLRASRYSTVLSRMATRRAGKPSSIVFKVTSAILPLSGASRLAVSTSCPQRKRSRNAVAPAKPSMSCEILAVIPVLVSFAMSFHVVVT